MGLFKKQQQVGRRRPSAGVGNPRSSQSLYTYRQNRSSRDDQLGRKAESDKPVKRQKPKVIEHLPALLLVIVIVLSIGYVSTLEVNPRITFVENNQRAEATDLRDPDVYQQAAQEYLKGSVLNYSKFLVDTNGLSQHLKSEFPEIATATVTLPIMGRRPVIELQATRPAFILVSATTSMLVGNNGVALVDVKDVANVGALNLRTVNDESGVSLEAGKAALPQEQAQFVSIIVEQLEKQNLTVESLTIPKSAYDLHVRVKGQPYYVKFNILEDPLQQTGSYLALRSKLEADKVTPAEYIDVRVGERVFYR